MAGLTETGEKLNETVPGPDGKKPVVVVDNVHVEYKVYAGGRRAPGTGRSLLSRTRGLRSVHALKGVSFTAYENESIGVIGSNGSGKSTLMRTMVGLTPPSQATPRPGPTCSASAPR
jgi:teichoic acid transport system ATP-binding protein